MNNLCLRPNEDKRARWVTCNWIQSPKKKRSQKKKKSKKERKERKKVGLDSNVGRRECQVCEWYNWALSNRGNTNFEMLTRLWEARKIRPLKKEKDFCVLFRAPLFLGKWYEVVTYFLYKKKKTKYKYMIELFPFIDWIKNTCLKNWKLHGFGS